MKNNKNLEKIFSKVKNKKFLNNKSEKLKIFLMKKILNKKPKYKFMNELELPNILENLKEKEIELIQEIKILLKGGIPVTSEKVIPFKNKLLTLQESLSMFRSSLWNLVNLKKLECSRYEGNSLDFYGDGKRRSKDDKKAEMLSGDNEYFDRHQTIINLESLLKYIDDMYFSESGVC